VAARVADPGQRIVLRQDRDRRPRAGALDRRAERGRQAADAPLDPRPVLLEELGEPGVRPLFLEGELGVAMDPVRERLQLVGEAVHRLGDLRLERVRRRGHVACRNSA
jgi:hypothetical protein